MTPAVPQDRVVRQRKARDHPRRLRHGDPLHDENLQAPVSVDRSDNDPVIEKVAKVAKLASKDLVKGKGCPVDLFEVQHVEETVAA